MAEKFWLKFNMHFFKDSHMIFLKSQPNGYQYIYLWQSLLLKCLEVDDSSQIGFLRLNDKIPYSPSLLSEVFGMNIDIIKSAIDSFVNLGMIELLEDGTIYIEAVQKMIGRESESAERVRLHRERKSQRLLQCNNDETNCNTMKSYSKSYSKNKNKNKNKNNKTEEKTIPSESNFPVEKLEGIIFKKRLIMFNDAFKDINKGEKINFDSKERGNLKRLCKFDDNEFNKKFSYLFQICKKFKTKQWYSMTPTTLYSKWNFLTEDNVKSAINGGVRPIV
jgi:predicted phage replisome organizer